MIAAMHRSLRQVKRTVGKWAWLCPLLAIVLAAWLLTVWGFTFWSALLAAVLLVCPALVLWGVFALGQNPHGK